MTAPEAGPNEDRRRGTTIRGILLDAGNTLVFVDPRRVLPVLREEGAEVEVDVFWEAEYAARRHLVDFIVEGDRGTEDHVWREYFLTLFRRCGIGEGALERVGARLLEIHGESHLWSHVDPATPPALERLSRMGYRLGIVSNADGRVDALIEAVGLRHHFEFVVDSDVAGVEKPDPRIFHMGVEKLGLEPSECLYVGDLFPVDVMGARRAGLEALLVDPFGRMGGTVDRIRAVSELPGYLESSPRPGGEP